MTFARPPTVMFLPLTTDAVTRVCQSAATAESRSDAAAVRRRAEEVEAAADRCWNALLAGCDSASRIALSPRLRLLSEAASQYGGIRWWFTDGTGHRRRVASAQSRIEEAIADGDGDEFAKAFVTYDHAMASAVVCARTRQPMRT